MDRHEAAASAERAFAIVTAAFHDLPELNGLISELSRDEAQRVVYALACMVKGLLIGTEVVHKMASGSILPQYVAATRARIPWLR